MTEPYEFTNRLINEKSPYLLQHAHNPVDWYPWGEEAFNVAKELNKPIFLSIGYATCHWCHVMEEESFKNVDVAKVLNQAFINIKVDREERPDVDGLYIEFAQSLISGSIGWPLNIILTPDLKPFFAATYLPPFTRNGLLGVSEMAQKIEESWYGQEAEEIQEQASEIVDMYNDVIHYKGDQLPPREMVDATIDLLFKMADPVFGGMQGAPKFPIGYQMNLLLKFSATHKESRAVFLVDRTLDMMQRGGIYDHLKGGFSRYSTDEKWLQPHFEKMLYDNALLIGAYIEAWQLTKRSLYKKIATEIIQYLKSDMLSSEGAFYCAEDADSEGKEGFYYTWDYDEVKEILGNDAETFCKYYQVTPEGNFEGRNILHTPLRLEEFAKQNGLDIDKLDEQFYQQKELLLQRREKRPHPFKDDKILTSWNGLMIASLSLAGAALSNKEYIDMAVKAATFIRNNLWKDNKLYRMWREGHSLHVGGVDDYAFLIKGLISLFEVGAGTFWLEWAIELTKLLQEDFKAEDGSFFQTDGGDPSIILRKSVFSDGAEPSGNAIHTENLLKLYAITQNNIYKDQAMDVLKAVKKYLDNYPAGYCYHIMNLNRFFDNSAPTIIVALNETEENKQEILQALYTHFIPHKSVVWKKFDDPLLIELIPFLENQPCYENKTTVYVCHQGVCLHPVNEKQEILEVIHLL